MSDRPAFTQASEGSNEQAVRTGTVQTATGNATVSSGGQAEIISITDADHSGLIIESMSFGVLAEDAADDVTASLWIGDNNATISFGEARVYLTAQLSGGAFDLTQPVKVANGEKVKVLIDNNGSVSAPVMGGLVHREDPYQ